MCQVDVEPRRHGCLLLTSDLLGLHSGFIVTQQKMVLACNACAPPVCMCSECWILSVSTLKAMRGNVHIISDDVHTTYTNHAIINYQ